MKKFYTSVLSFSFATIGVFSTYAQQIQKMNRNDDFRKKSSEELAKSNGFDRCSFVEYEEYLQRNDPNRMTTAQFEAWLAPLVEKVKEERLANKSTSGGVVTIPVVVHVIHSGEAYGVGANITDEQVQSQIAVMNQDFRKMIGTPGYNANAVGADTMIQFALAKVDVNGNPTNGIDRVNLCYPDWSTGNINGYVKPLTIWSPTQYMNMWSVKFSDNSLLGYAQFPSNSTIPMPAGGSANTDGVVANYTTFGSTDFGNFPMNAPYDKGRTMTHEVGHFLGLRHIWGDGNCATDYCADTPTAHTANYVCNKNIASCDSPSVFEMVENYMDYTNDTCMNIFTQNQKDRITTVMNNSPRRVELKTSAKDLPIPLFSNDAEIKFENVCSLDNFCTGYIIKIILTNRGTSALTSAIIPYTINGTSYSYNWSGNLAQDKYAVVSLPVPTTATNGALTVNLTSVNGVADQRTSNNALTGNFSNPLVPANTGTNFVFNLQLDYWGSEVNWNLKNGAGAIVYSSVPYSDVPNPTSATPLPALITQNWVLNTNDCYTFTINDVYGDGIYDNGGFYNIKTAGGADVIVGSTYSKKQTRSVYLGTLGTNEIVKETFAIYPNPATDLLNVTKVSNKARYEIHNAVGQIVKSGEINDNQVRIAELIKGSYIITIKDKDISQSIKFIKK